MKRCICIDWLTMYCSCSMIVKNKRWEWKKEDHGTAQFKDLYKVYDKETKEQYCTVQKTPYSPVVPKNAVMVQVSNRYLYRKNWNVELNNFMLASNIIPITISRIDISCDFTEFANGVHPERFIQNVVKQKYRYAGRSKVNLTATNKKGLVFEYMRIGSRDSEISSYLYNKSLELREVMNKPYIREMWEQSGLDTTKDVWRLEVSLSNKQMRTIIKETGEVFRLDLDFIKTQGALENVYMCAINKSFTFKHNKKGERTTRLRDVKLFESKATTLLMTVPTNEAKTNRMDKIVLKRITNYFGMYRVEEEEDIDKMVGAIEVLLKQQVLKDYFYEKILPTVMSHKER